MDKKTIPMFFSFDNNYVAQAGVTFESLLANAKQGVFYELNVLHTKISEASQKRLIKLVTKHKNATLNFIDVSKFNFEFSDKNFALQYGGATFTVDTLYRCIPDLIPEFDKYEKIIYSDVDIVIVDDISELYDVDLEEKYLAGVKAPQFLHNEFLHVDKKLIGNYFAGGLWVMNLAKIRKDNLGQKILKLIKNPPYRFIWNDQDVMNLACDLKVAYIPYIYISIPDWLPLLEKMNFKDEYYPNNELYEAMYNPKIIHYAGIKPWGKHEAKKADLWFKWLDKTEFKKDFRILKIKKFFRKFFNVFWNNDILTIAIGSGLPYKGSKIKINLLIGKDDN